MRHSKERRESVAVGPISPSSSSFSYSTPSYSTPSSEEIFDLPEIEETKESAEEINLEILRQIQAERDCLEALRLSQETERLRLEEVIKNQKVQAEQVLAQQRAILIEQQRLEQERTAIEQKKASEAQAVANVISVARSLGFN